MQWFHIWEHPELAARNLATVRNEGFFEDFG